MAQLDDIVGAVMEKLKDDGLDDNTIVVFTTDNGAENFTWPDGGQTPFAGGKGTVLEGGFRVPCILRWPGKVPAGKVENGLMSGLDWFPTFLAAAGNPNIVDELKKGKKLDGTHLQGPPRRLRPDRLHHRQGALEARTRSSTSPRRPSARCASATTSTDSSISRAAGSAARSRSTGRCSSTSGSTRSSEPACQGRSRTINWFKYQFWRFVFVQQEVAKFAETFIEFPPMQKRRRRSTSML